MTYSLSSLSIKDAGGTSRLINAYNDGTQYNFAHSLLDGAGALVTTTNGLPVNIAQVGASALALGQALAAASIPVVLTAAQITSLTAPVLGAGSAIVGKVTTDQTTHGTTDLVAADITKVGGTGLALGQTTMSASIPVTIASNQGSVLVNPPGTVHLTSSPTVTSGAYVTGQVVGGLVSLSGATRINAGSGIIQTAVVTVKTALTAPFDVLFFDTNPTNSTFTDNSSLAINVADLPFLCGVAHCTDLVSGGTPQILQATGLSIPFKLSASATTLYAVIVMRGGETLASSSAIQLSVVIIQD